MKTIDLQAEQTTAIALTRKEKLLRWSDIVRSQPFTLQIFHHLEHWSSEMLQRPLASYGNNAFTIAAEDPVFRAAGLKGDSAQDAMNFFEMKKAELHEFSCDCGGHISNTKMADRIAALADPRTPSMFSFLGGRGH